MPQVNFAAAAGEITVGRENRVSSAINPPAGRTALMMNPTTARALLLASILFGTAAAGAADSSPVDPGARPLELIDALERGPLKSKLESCAGGPFHRSDFAIGHRGAPLRFPEHTRESYQAAARLGAGTVECDVTFTRDKALVCRHSQCDLHTTTNILDTELASKCSEPFEPAVFDKHGNLLRPARARCCTSDITLAEFKTLKGKQDGFNERATSPGDYLALAEGDPLGTLLSHRESIALFQQLGVKMTPELKSPAVEMPFAGMDQRQFAQRMIDQYKEAGVDPSRVFPQSFNLADVLYWIENEPAFGKQAVYLDDRDSDPAFDHRNPDTWDPGMEELAARGVKILAPPIWMLLDADGGEIVPSPYAKAARAAGLDIITWSLERSGSLAGGGGWYYQSVNGENPNPGQAVNSLIDDDGDMLIVLDVLARQVGVLAVFSDWPGTVTYYANCMGLP